MAESSILSSLRAQFRGEAPVDFCDSSARLKPCCHDSTADGTNHQLVDDLHHAFRTAGYVQLRQIGITHQNGHVTLRGRVSTYFLKQVAQTLAWSRPGVQVVDNDIEVACPRLIPISEIHP